MNLSTILLCGILFGAEPDPGSNEMLLQQIRASYRERTNAIRTLQIRFRQMPRFNADGEYIR